MLEEYSKWIQAARELERDLKKFKHQKRELEITARTFYRFNPSHLVHARNSVEQVYNKIQDLQRECEFYLKRMGNLGDEMKHYSNLNKTLMLDVMHKVENRREKLKAAVEREEKRAEREAYLKKRQELKLQKKQEKEARKRQKILDMEAKRRRKQEKGIPSI